MKTKLKFIIPVILLIMLISIILIINNKPVENETPTVTKSVSDIDRIEIEDGEYLFGYKSNHVIDFKTNTFTSVYSDSNSEDNEETIGHFSDKAKENFVRLANKYGFFSWHDYVNLNIEDGGYTEFLIVYIDGSQKEIWCDNAYPDTYESMWGAVRELRSNSY